MNARTQAPRPPVSIVGSAAYLPSMSGVRVWDGWLDVSPDAPSAGCRWVRWSIRFGTNQREALDVR